MKVIRQRYQPARADEQPGRPTIEEVAARYVGVHPFPLAGQNKGRKAATALKPKITHLLEQGKCVDDICAELGIKMRAVRRIFPEFRVHRWRAGAA